MWWLWWCLIGFVAGRFGEMILKFCWQQAKDRGWVK